METALLVWVINTQPRQHTTSMLRDTMRAKKNAWLQHTSWLNKSKLSGAAKSNLNSRSSSRKGCKITTSK
jgi:hypothetical protein